MWACRTLTSPERVTELPAMLVGVEALDMKVEFDEAAQVRRARVVKQVSYDAALAEAASLGVRPASPDEWEYACGAGARTLFRWGDDSPGNGYPYDHKSGPHREPNQWGLLNSPDGYIGELFIRPVIDIR